MEYLLVLQLPGSQVRGYDEMVGLERRVTRALGDLGRVDGHDATFGDLHIFVLTQRPIEALDRLHAAPGISDLVVDLKASFRRIDERDYEVRLGRDGSRRVHIG
jgi:hypothetical protein